MQNVIKAGGIVINSSGEVLIITNDLGKQTFPKGTPETDEELIDTARREINEESGLTDFKILGKLGVIVRPGYSDDNKITPSVIKHIHMYYCSTDQIELSPLTPDAQKANWVKPDEVAAFLSWPEEVKFFEVHRDKLKL